MDAAEMHLSMFISCSPGPRHLYDQFHASSPYMAERELQIAIIGAGLGGLAAAIARWSECHYY